MLPLPVGAYSYEPTRALFGQAQRKKGAEKLYKYYEPRWVLAGKGSKYPGSSQTWPGTSWNIVAKVRCSSLMLPQT